MKGSLTSGLAPFAAKIGGGLAASLLISALSAGMASAQTPLYVDRYSFNDGGTTVVDSVSGRNGTLANGASESGGALVLPAGGGANAPQVTLPANYLSAANLLNATFEIDISNVLTGTGGYACLLGFGTAAGSGGNGNFFLLQSNRANPSGTGPVYLGLRTSSTSNEDGHTGTAIPTGTANHAIDVVFSGYTSPTSGGTVTIYQDGVQTQSSAEPFSLAQITPTGLNAIGSGGTYNDPSFGGSITDLRIYNSALTAAQVATNFAAGPDVVGVGAAAPEPGSIAMLLGGILPLAGGVAMRRRKRA